MYIYLQPNNIHTPLVLDCPHSQRTLRTCVRKLHTLMRKCLLPQHSRNSPMRPASPRPLCRAIPRQSLACPATRCRRRREAWIQTDMRVYTAGLRQAGTRGRLRNSDDVRQSVRRGDPVAVGGPRHPGVLRPTSRVSAHRLRQVVSIDGLLPLASSLIISHSFVAYGRR